MERRERGLTGFEESDREAISQETKANTENVPRYSRRENNNAYINNYKETCLTGSKQNEKNAKKSTTFEALAEARYSKSRLAREFAQPHTGQK